MKQIPEDLIEDVEKITKELIIYNNKDNLSWIQVYKEVLNKLNMQERKEEVRLLTNVVTNITKLGYDIIDKPFKLEKYI